jgi:hypothetical protein
MVEEGVCVKGKVTVRSDSEYWNVLRRIGKLGELRVSSVSKTNGRSEVTFRERTLGEWLQDKFSFDKSASRKAREKVFDALVPLIKGSRSSDQLLQNIRDRIDHDVGISGRALKRDYAPVDAGRRVRPLQGGTTTAISKGNSVQILEGDPAKIKCSHAVLQLSTASTEASRHPKLQTVHKSLGRFAAANPNPPHQSRDQPVQIGITSTSFKVDVAATSWSCITDLRLPEFGTNQAEISEKILENLVVKAVGDQSGAVVIEVIPDHLEEHHGEKSRSYTDKGLQAQIRAATHLVAKAKKDKKNLVITFACKDVSVLNQMRDIVRLDAALKIGAIKQNEKKTFGD